MSDGVRSADLPAGVSVDSLIGNNGDGTVTINIGRLAALLNGYIGPAYQTRAQLFADLAWPSKSLAQVYGDSTAAYIGTYQKSGNSGSGSWTRIGDLPASAVGAAQIAAEATTRATDDTGLRNAVRDGSILALTNIAGTSNAITADLSPAAISAGITALSTNTALDLKPTATNTAANPTLTVAGVTYGIRDADGGAWPASAFVPGRSYLLRRQGAILRVTSGDLTAVDVAYLRRDRVATAVQRRAGLPARPNADMVMWSVWEDPSALMRPGIDIWVRAYDDNGDPITPVTSVSDSFDRFNGRLSNDDRWVDIPWAAVPAAYMTIVDNEVQVSQWNAAPIARLADTLPPDQKIQAQILQAGDGTQSYLGVFLCLRMQGMQMAGYRLRLTAGTLWAIERMDAGNTTAVVLASGTHALTMPFTARLEAEGSTLRAYLNGALVGTVTDATYDGGTGGISARAQNSATQKCRIDSVVAGSL